MIREDSLTDAGGEALWPFEGAAATLLHCGVAAADSCDLHTSIDHKNVRINSFVYEVVKKNNVSAADCHLSHLKPRYLSVQTDSQRRNL